MNEYPEWHGGSLTGSMRAKVRGYIEGDLIRKINEETYMVFPLPRRHQTHIVRYADGMATCDCQGFKKNGTCSHVAAVRQFREEKRRAIE